MKNPFENHDYRGPNRRSGQERRRVPDRREEIRWEPDKDDRRSGQDRRRNVWDDKMSR